jgi:hypothetical protein
VAPHVTVAELIAELQKLDQDARIVITWESVLRDITPDHVYVSRDGVAMLDGDDNFYKASFVEHGLDRRSNRAGELARGVSNAQPPSLSAPVGIGDIIPTEVETLPSDPCVYQLTGDTLFDADDVQRFIRGGGSISNNGFRVHTRSK